LVVAGLSGADLAVRGIRREPARVADRRRVDARRLPELLLRAPEAAEAEEGELLAREGWEERRAQDEVALGDAHPLGAAGERGRGCRHPGLAGMGQPHGEGLRDHHRTARPIARDGTARPIAHRDRYTSRESPEEPMIASRNLPTLALLLLAVPASAQEFKISGLVKPEYDKTRDFSKYKTFTWSEAQERGSNPADHVRIFGGIENELQAKG